MLYWLVIVISLLVCSIWASTYKGYKWSNPAILTLVLILIYLTSFRLGLGMDYAGYLNKVYWANNTGVINWINEPMITLLSLFIDNTRVTPLFLFLFFSVITIPCFFSYYCRKDNKYWLGSIAVFILLPILFYNTFNLVRQFAAAAIFFYSIRYIEKRSVIPYLLCILLAASMHMTALILLPLYFFVNRMYRPSSILIFFGGLFMLFTLVYPMIEGYVILEERFSVYLHTKEQMGTSGLIILYNILGVLMLLFRNKFTTSLEIISYNLFFFFILFSDLSFVNYYFFRIAVYFSPAFAVVFPKLLGIFMGRRGSTIVSWLFALIFFIPFILGNQNNPIVVPSGILPISALWDTSQYQIVYNIAP